MYTCIVYRYLYMQVHIHQDQLRFPPSATPSIEPIIDDQEFLDIKFRLLGS